MFKHLLEFSARFRESVLWKKSWVSTIYLWTFGTRKQSNHVRKFTIISDLSQQVKSIKIVRCHFFYLIRSSLANSNKALKLRDSKSHSWGHWFFFLMWPTLVHVQMTYWIVECHGSSSSLQFKLNISNCGFKHSPGLAHSG